MQGREGFTLVDLLVVLAIVGLLVACGTAAFAKRQAQSLQSEAKTNLKAMYQAEMAFSAEKHRFSTLVREIGFSPERNNRYAYFVGSSGTLEDRSKATAVSLPTDTGVQFDSFKFTDRFFPAASLNAVPSVLCNGSAAPGIAGTVWTGTAQGQIDTDASFDVWSISTEDRTLAGATCDQPGPDPKGEPANELNDEIH